MLRPIAAARRRGAAGVRDASGVSSPISKVATISAPTGGWNARDPLSSMSQDDAIQLDNFIPDIGGVKVRAGKEEHVTGAGTFVETLMEYRAPDGTANLFAASVDKIYDVTSAGLASESVASMFNGRWQHTMFATSGGNYLICCNGENGALSFNGSTWSQLVVTGVATADLIGVTAHMNRLWFIEKDTLSVWYLGISAIAGAATEIDFAPLCKRGGHLLAMGSWTRDGGAGIEDLAVFITSQGEALVYGGSDPSSASTWALQGIFRIPFPVGRRCLCKLGADIGILTSKGVLPLSVILPLSESGAANIAVTDKIADAVHSAYNGGKTLFGWELVESPKHQLLIMNVPSVERSVAYQFVMNTKTGAWCRFTSLNAGCWTTFGDDLYWGGHNGTIWKYTGTSDDGEDINVVSVSAFSSLGTPSKKRVTMARPMTYGPSEYSPSIAFRVDYEIAEAEYSAESAESSAAMWDNAEWDVAEWAVSLSALSRWQSAFALGSVVSVAIAAAVSEEFQYNQCDLMFEVGGYV